MSVSLFTSVSENFLNTPDVEFEVTCPIITENGGEALADEAIVISTNSIEGVTSYPDLITWRNAAVDVNQYATDFTAFVNANVLGGVESFQEEKTIILDFNTIVDDYTLDPNLINLNGRAATPAMIFSSIFGTNRDNTDIDEYLPSTATTIFLQAISLRARSIKVAFPNCKIAVNMFGIYDTDGFPNLVTETENGIRNFLLYINREAPFIRGWAYDVNTNDPTPDEYAQVFDDIDIGIGQLFLPVIYENEEILPVEDPNFPNVMQQVQELQPLQILDTYQKSFTSEPTTAPGYNPLGDYDNDLIINELDPPPSSAMGGVNAFFDLNYLHTVTYENLDFPLVESSFLTLDQFNNMVSGIQILNFDTDLYFRTNELGISAFNPTTGVIVDPDDSDDFDIDDETQLGPTDNYVGQGQLINLDLFNTSGCDQPPLPLPESTLNTLRNVITGEAFRSPVEGAVNGVIEGAGQMIGELSNSFDAPLLLSNGSPALTTLDDNGVPRAVTVSEYLSEKLVIIREVSDTFQSHAYRLSGVSNYKEGFEAGGSIGDLPGLTGLQALAQNYNNVKNALDSGNIGEVLVDHYSPFFGSILGPGQALYDSVNSLINGNIRGFLDEFPTTEDGRLNLTGFRAEQVDSLLQIGRDALDLQISIENLIESDNSTYFAALDYISKTTVGFSVLSMMEDPCFSQKLLGQIAKPDLKGLLNLS
jgi:hypothetical protein